MAEFFFNRHNGTTHVEPFSEYKYSTEDYYYNQAPLGCTDAMLTACNTQTVTGTPTTAQTDNCLCKYKKNVDTYLKKTDSDMTINGMTNDNIEKYSNLAIKNINLGIGIGMMMIYIYSSTNQ
jgi:hypothetical protein